MEIPFWKMHGAGNDFILVDDRKQTFPERDSAFIERISRRCTGVGCEGVILIQPSDTDDFRMRFFNPDGSEAEMCGNGARCAARLAADIGIAPARMSIATPAGRLHAKSKDSGRVKIWMTEPSNWRLRQRLTVNGEEMVCHHVNTGVPHAVVCVDDLAAVDVEGIGRAIRRHEAFAWAGANANFFHPTGESALAVRTYERGVEAETMACGTGIVACGLVAGILGLVRPPVDVSSACGEGLVVDYRMTASGVTNVTLEGPAEYVFTGIVSYG